jgi:hypothetical protein
VKISKTDLDWAESAGVLTRGQARTLWSALERRHSGQPRFDAAHVAYYLGALIVIGAMGWYVTDGWDAFTGAELSIIGLAYAAVFVVVGRRIWDRRELRVPAGLLFTMAVCMVPLVVFGIERAAGLWPDGDPGGYRAYHALVKGSWVLMELGTILAGVLALRMRRFPFLTAPIAVSLWYLSMDLAPLLHQAPDETLTPGDRSWVSACFGLAMLLATYLADLRSRLEGDFVFWGYLFGLMAFWGGLSSLDNANELGRFVYLVINVGLIATSLVLMQRAFLVFGALGVCGYLWQLAYLVFRDSVAFPFVLSLVGVVVIYLGALYQRHRVAIERFALSRLPAALRALVPDRVRDAG